MAIPGFIDGPVAVQLAHVSVIYALVIVYAMVGLRFPVAVAACWGRAIGLVVVGALRSGC